MPGRLLLIDDDAAVRDAMSSTLKRRGFDVVSAQSGADGLAALERSEFDVVLSDFNMPGMSGIELCRRAHATRPNLPVVLVTAFGATETAVAALRAGVDDFITKPVQVPELMLALSRALEHRQRKEESKQLRDTVARQHLHLEMIGESPAMQAVCATLGQLQDTDANVLITGESGTGKELVAQAVHRQGSRRAGPLVAVNCAAVPESMLESELFGHARGAFTDATANRKGLFVQAHGGTLFLDEIGEMPLCTQVKLLRALQERTVRPVGSDREVPFDARLISATSRDLEADVADHRFREDLYYRINVIGVHMPPLRSRGSDVLLLAEHFIRRFAERSSKRLAGLEAATATKLATYVWPGNVRELQNCIERAVALTRSDQITLDDLPAHISAFEGKHCVRPVEKAVDLLSMDEVERRHVLQVLNAVGGSKTKAALALGFDRRTLHRKLKQYGVP